MQIINVKFEMQTNFDLKPLLYYKDTKAINTKLWAYTEIKSLINIVQ